MEERVRRAVENYEKKGYNCSQAVVCAFSDLAGIDEKTAFRMAEGFGGGVAGTQGICGAVTGMVMVEGLLESKGNLERPKDGRPETFAAIKEMIEEFRQKCGSITCADIKGVNNGGVPLCSCKSCVEHAACLLFFQEK